MSKVYQFKPALIFNWLTPFYDAFGDYTGFRKGLQKKALQTFKLKDGWKLLDVGSGTGPDLILLKSLYPKMKLAGIDADAKIVAIAEKKVKKLGLDIKFTRAFAEDMPFADNSFDAVWSNLTLHHMPTESKKKALKEMYRVLKPKGYLFLIEFSKPGHPILDKLVVVQNLFSYTKDHFQGKLPLFIKQAGFEKIKEKKYWFRLSCFTATK